MVVVCEASGKRIKFFMEDKATRLKQERRRIRIILLVAAFVVFVISFFVRDDTSKYLFRSMGFAFLVASSLLLLFKGEFGYKPTREELEAKVFGEQRTER